MGYQPFYISSFENESGLDTYLEPFLIPEKAFPQLEDAFAWRGRITRRDGYKFLGRLRRILTATSLGNINSTNTTFNIFSALGVSDETNAEIEPGNSQNITITIAAPISETLTDTTGTGVMTVVPGTAITAASLNYATGVLSLTFSGVYANSAATITGAYFPTLPVTGLRTRDIIATPNNNNDEQMVAFDTKYAYIYDFATKKFKELATAPGTPWNGSNYNLFWTTSYYQVGSNIMFWATTLNDSATRTPIRYYDGTQWNDFSPLKTANDKLYFCLCMVAYKNRLLCFNTFEGTTAGGIGAATNFPQRMRYSQNGTPLVSVDATAWREDIVGKGGFIDIPTGEAIVSVEFIKDELIVKCERSSWKVVYTGNELLPFIFQKINTELGSESTFSLVPFDRGVYSVGNFGITTDDSVNVFRIDQRIPQTVFKISNSEHGPERVYGVRDYSDELVFWAYPSTIGNADVVFPNKVLVYNYINQTWAIFNDSFTCFGYFQDINGETWQSLNTVTWEAKKSEWAASSSTSLFPSVVGGNQHGFVEILSQQVSNDVSLSIKTITPHATNPVKIGIPDHNLNTGDFIKITGIIGSGSPNPNTLNDQIYKVVKVDADTITLQINDPVTPNVLLAVGGTYLGNGKITYISNITIKTKVFSPFYEQGAQARLGYVDFFLNKTTNGEVSVNLYIDENNSVVVNDPNALIPNGGILGSNTVLTRPENLTLIPIQQFQDKIWHRLFTHTVCQNFQLEITLDDDQMFDESVANSDITLHAMAIYLSPNARLTQ